MRVMVLVKATAASESGPLPAAEMTKMFAAMGAYNEQLVEAGIMKDAGGLKPSAAGARIAFDGDDRMVRDGPFAVNEVVAGFWIWEVADMSDAVAWAKRCPNPMPGPSELEIRPLQGIEDFAEFMTPELDAQDQRLRDALATDKGCAEEEQDGNASY